jgi:hypothetical protein
MIKLRTGTKFRNNSCPELLSNYSQQADLEIKGKIICQSHGGYKTG